jgi:hypothetical protein
MALFTHDETLCHPRAERRIFSVEEDCLNKDEDCFNMYPKGNHSKLNDIGNFTKDFTKQQIRHDLNELMRLKQKIRVLKFLLWKWSEGDRLYRFIKSAN